MMRVSCCRKQPIALFTKKPVKPAVKREPIRVTAAAGGAAHMEDTSLPISSHQMSVDISSSATAASQSLTASQINASLIGESYSYIPFSLSCSDNTQ